MKNKTQLISMAAPLMMVPSAMAAVTVAGVDSSTDANWRTSAAFEADNEYGTLGYVLFGLTSADNVYQSPFDPAESNAENEYNLPATLTLSSDYAGAMWPGNAAENFGTMEDPTNGNAITTVGLLANGNATTWTLQRSAPGAFRITLMLSSGDGGETLHSATMDDGTGAVSTTPTAHTADGLHYHVFDVTEGTGDITFTNSPQDRNLTGIAIDSYVPEPSSAALLSLGGLALILRRRK